jgi:hypothetical protein
MSNPQPPERVPGTDAPSGPVPLDNQPGHHPSNEQDKPDLDAFAERLGTMEPGQRAEPSEERHGPHAASANRGVLAGVAALVAAVLVVVLGVMAGRRLRSRSSG